MQRAEQTVTTKTQQAIFDQLDHCSDIQDMRDQAHLIAEKVGCSKTYVLRMISRREKEASKPIITVREMEPEPEEEIDSELFESLTGEEEPDFEEDLDEALFEPEPEDRIPKEDRLEDIEDLVDLENIGTLISIPYRFAAMVTDSEVWLLTKEEKDRLAPLGKRILIKYLPEIMTKYFVEIVFCVVALEITGSKANAWRKEREQKLMGSPDAESLEAKAREKIEERAEVDAKLEEDSKPEEPVKRIKGVTDGTPQWMDGRKIG